MISPAHLKLLQSVSRSFYLSIRFLPPPMREPVALGYLLARLTDTIADAGGIETPRRLELLEAMRRVIQGGAATDLLDLSAVVSGISHSGERELLRRADELIDWYGSIDSANRSHLSEVVLTIIHGQQWDVTNFAEGQVAACETADDLLRYTYWVAGCVGEFWTKVGFTNLGRRFSSPDNAARMLVQGRKLGQGLQLINVLRDLHEDLPMGRCYLPENELRAAGWDGSTKLSVNFVEPVFLHWLDQCQDFLSLSEAYAAPIRSYRAAFSTRLPMELAKKTAAGMRAAGCGVVMREKVKIPRSEVWKSIIRMGFL